METNQQTGIIKQTNLWPVLRDFIQNTTVMSCSRGNHTEFRHKLWPICYFDVLDI